MIVKLPIIFQKENDHERSADGVFYVCRSCRYGDLAYGVRQGIVGIVCPRGLRAFCRDNGHLPQPGLLEEMRAEIADRPDFPCVRLMPAADRADTYPHNMKPYNLCRMKLVGVEKWAEKESLKIRKTYFKGKFVPGAGPVAE